MSLISTGRRPERRRTTLSLCFILIETTNNGEKREEDVNPLCSRIMNGLMYELSDTHTHGHTHILHPAITHRPLGQVAARGGEEERTTDEEEDKKETSDNYCLWQKQRQKHQQEVRNISVDVYVGDVSPTSCSFFKLAC